MAAEVRRVGVDVGGTFTDIVTVEDGRIGVEKVPSVPEAPDEGVLSGLHATLEAPSSVEYIGHGTTVATNAMLEREWADTALVTTAGFRDVLEIGRQSRSSLYDLDVERPEPIVPREHRFEVTERIDERGNVETALAEDDLAAIVASIREIDVDAVAICLLFSYENEEHERLVAEAIETADLGVNVSRSSAVLPEIREYERTLATAVNAALTPIMDQYLGRLDSRLGARGIDARLHVMQSNGGVISATRARHRPVNTLLSGPAAGVQAAAHLASLAGYENAITMDMGGTSCDVSLVEDGEPLVSTEVSVGDYPIGVPMVDIHTIGAGGGSIGWLDDGGALRVGPRSAGADPGPICYGRGGTAPTITDAHAVLGRIEPASFLPADLSPDREATRAGIKRALAEPLDRDVSAAASGMLQVADANMERALRVVSVERGYDPRSFALVAFGGAGPLHATRIARALEIPTVLVPRHAGVLSALGLLLTDVVREASTSHVRRWAHLEASELNDLWDRLATRATSELSANRDDLHLERSLDMRYVGQSFSIRVPVDGPLDPDRMARIRDRFDELHDRRYGHTAPTEPVELETVRLRAREPVETPSLRVTSNGETQPPSTDTRTAYIDGSFVDTPVFDRSSLSVGATVSGPAIVEGPASTTLLHGDQEAAVDPYGTLVITSTGGTAS